MTVPTPEQCLSTLEVRVLLSEQPPDEGANRRLRLALAWALPILRAHVAHPGGFVTPEGITFYDDLALMAELVEQDAPPAVVAACPTCGGAPAPTSALLKLSKPNLTDRLIAALGAQPGRPIRELAGVLYGADTTGSRSKVRALLAQLRRLGRVQRVAAGHWEVLALPTRALFASSSTPRNPRTGTATATSRTQS